MKLVGSLLTWNREHNMVILTNDMHRNCWAMQIFYSIYTQFIFLNQVQLRQKFQTHGPKIMGTAFHVPETLVLTTEPSGTLKRLKRTATMKYNKAQWNYFAAFMSKVINQHFSCGRDFLDTISVISVLVIVVAKTLNQAHVLLS